MGQQRGASVATVVDHRHERGQGDCIERLESLTERQKSLDVQRRRVTFVRGVGHCAGR